MLVSAKIQNLICILGKSHCSKPGEDDDDQSSDSETDEGCVSEAADLVCLTCTHQNKPEVSLCEICGNSLKVQLNTEDRGEHAAVAASRILCQPRLNQLSIDLFLERLLLPIQDTAGVDTSPSASLPSFMSSDAYVHFSKMDVSILEARQIIDAISQQSSADSSWADREIVQEQQQEREEQKEVQVFQVVQPQGDRDPQRDISWQVTNAHMP